MTTDFTKLLEVPVESVKAPQPLPTGSFTFVVTGHEFGESQQKKTPFVRFNVKPMSPGADVDTALMPDNWREKEMKLDYFLTSDAMFRLKDFLENLGINVSGRTFSEAIPETTGQSFTGNIVHEVSKKDNKTVFANIGTIAKA